jgi:hypothetical protein
MDLATPPNLPVAPLAPLFIPQQGQDSAALVLVTAPQSMLGIDPAAKEDSIAASPPPDLGGNRGQTEGTGGGQAVEAVSQSEIVAKTWNCPLK